MYKSISIETNLKVNMVVIIIFIVGKHNLANIYKNNMFAFNKNVYARINTNKEYIEVITIFDYMINILLLQQCCEFHFLL